MEERIRASLTEGALFLGMDDYLAYRRSRSNLQRLYPFKQDEGINLLYIGISLALQRIGLDFWTARVQGMLGPLEPERSEQFNSNILQASSGSYGIMIIKESCQGSEGMCGC